MADADDSMGLAKHLKEEVSTIKFTVDGVDTSNQLQRDILNDSESVWSLQDSESQSQPLPIENHTLEDLGKETCSVESEAESRRRGMCVCCICSSFLLQGGYKYQFIDE